MRPLFLAYLLLVTPLFCFAQSDFDINGNYSIGGSLGIGVPIPDARLHLSGEDRKNLRLYRNGSQTNYLSIWQGNGAAFIEPIGSNKLYMGYDQPANVFIGVDNTGGTRNPASARLGIGTTTSGAKLNIRAKGRESIRLYHDDDVFNNTVYTNFWQGPTFSVIDPLGTGKLYLGYDKATNVIIGHDNNNKRSSGKLGIGTKEPISPIHVVGDDQKSLRLYKDGNVNNYLSIWQGNGAAFIEPIGSNKLFLGYNEPTNVLIGVNPNGTVSSGKLGIGTNSPDAELTVKGKIHTQSIKCDLKGAVMPDYVFSEDYKLRTLKETEAYISKHKHLPEIPSASDVQKNGLELKEMSLKLLEKVEELTLHLIEENKRNESLRSEIKQLRSDVNKLKEKQ